MNNLAILKQTAQTMSSRELAQLCDKEHRNVLRDIDLLNETYTHMGLPKIEQGYYTHPSTGSQQHREFLLTKEQSIDLVTGYRADIRIRIDAGMMTEKLNTFVGGDGRDRSAPRVKFTPKGITHIAKMLKSKEVA